MFPGFGEFIFIIVFVSGSSANSFEFCKRMKTERESVIKERSLQVKNYVGHRVTASLLAGVSSELGDFHLGFVKFNK